MSASQPDSLPGAPARAPRAFVWAAAVALLAYGVFLFWHTSPIAGGSDQSGYLNSARLMAEGRLQDEQRIPAEFGTPAQLPRHHFMPLGYVALQENPKLPPTYAPGVPLQLAPLGKLFGWNAAGLIVALLSALGAVWLCYLVARELGLGVALAAAGAVMLAASPVFLFTSIQVLSDTPATTWCLLAAWLALRARRSAHGGWALGCGVAFAMAVFIRATNAVMLPALLVLLGLNAKRLSLALLGGLPGALWLGFYNHTLYGSALRSGYGAIEETFKWGYGPRSLKHIGYWLAVLSPAALLVLPLAGVWRARSRALLASLLWFGAITFVYVFYEVTHETWWCLRFILPALPPLIFAGLLAIEALGPQRRVLAAAVLAAWALGCTVYWTPRLHALLAKEHDAVYRDACREAEKVFPKNTLVACFYTSGAVYFYTDFAVLRWEQIGPEDFARYATLARQAGRPVGAMLFDGFEDAAQKERMPGEWKRVATVGKIGLWELVNATPTPPR